MLIHVRCDLRAGRLAKAKTAAASSAIAPTTLRLLNDMMGMGEGRTLHSRTNDRQAYANSDKCARKEDVSGLAFLARRIITIGLRGGKRYQGHFLWRMCLFRQPPPNRVCRRRNRLPAWPVPGRFCRRGALGVRSFVTPVIRATLPSSAEARTTTPEPSFWRRASTIWRRASRSTFRDLGRQHANALDLADLLEQGLRLRAGGLALQAFELLFQLLDRVRSGARWRR